MAHAAATIPNHENNSNFWLDAKMRRSQQFHLLVKDLSRMLDSSPTEYVNCHGSFASSSDAVHGMSDRQQCSESIIFLVLDLRDHTVDSRLRFKPPDDPRS